ncbi:MAG: hypothetical protein JXA35_11540 [Deltaproteobacteria bacterium]|nr:hypothetical protein [Deltaproteobacteria bacterium]
MFGKGKNTLDKKAPPHSSEMTVMIVRGVGKVRSFKLSTRFLFWSLLFFVLYIIASVIIINEYFSEIRKSRIHSGQHQQLKQEFEEKEKELYRTNQHLAFLKDYINKIESGETANLEPPEIKREKPEAEIPEPYPGSGEVDEVTVERETVHSEPEKDAVDIKDFNFKQEGAELTVDFRLINTGQSKDAVSGYVHIIAVDDKEDSQQFWASPKVLMQEGVPVNYKQGQLFVIKYFKEIRGRYLFETADVSPSFIKVLVYNRSGDLILERVFEKTGVS